MTFGLRPLDNTKTSKVKMITLDETAREKIIDLYIDDNDASIKGMRVFVQGGGCSGFSYGFTWESEKNEDDFEIPIDDKIQVFVDALSMQYLQGSTIKFKTELMGSNFVIENPNATNKCGCGSSFAV
jgi:iron-sulfur cluster insertion protein